MALSSKSCSQISSFSSIVPCNNSLFVSCNDIAWSSLTRVVSRSRVCKYPLILLMILFNLAVSSLRSCSLALSATSRDLPPKQSPSHLMNSLYCEGRSTRLTGETLQTMPLSSTQQWLPWHPFRCFVASFNSRRSFTIRDRLSEISSTRALALKSLARAATCRVDRLSFK